jgi:formylglycine-generating enzyme required for sulfatase activity/class 3 adenylate cyclase
MGSSDLKRKLATILVADIVGYSRLTASDEDWTIHSLTEFRAIVDEIIASHDGRIFSTGGDSVLAEFGSPVEAVRCAVDFQEAARSRNLLQPTERQLRYRIGVNLGDVMVRGTDLLGDGVNVAARLEGLAEPGGICVSGTVWDQINGKLSVGYVDLGEQSLKNFPRPVRAYLLRVNGSVEEIAVPAPTSVPPDVATAAAKRSLPSPALAGALALTVIAAGGLAWELWPERRPDSRTQLPETSQSAQPRASMAPQSSRGFKPGQSFQDCPSCPEMIVLPAGQFLMGAGAGDHERMEVPGAVAQTELPQHEVTIAKPFAIAKFDVTRAQFAVFAQATQFQPTKGCGVFRIQEGTSERKVVSVASYTWQDPSFDQTDRDPVVCVNTSDIEAYLRWLRSETGRPYRLPSEAEWEYAARGNTTTLYYWGDDPGPICLYENVFDETAKKISNPGAPYIPCSDGYGQSAPVGSFKNNSFGLYDMLGNVSVLLDDCWHDTYANAPTDGSSWLSGDCTKRVTRKGSFSHNRLWRFRASARFLQGYDYRFSRTGFRVAVSLQ